jgi:predicted O-methyltransferase YrrM
VNLLEIAKKLEICVYLHVGELEKLIELACNRDVLEVGCYRGGSAWGMGLTAKSLTCVDTFRAATDGVRQMENLTTYRDFLRATERYDSKKFLMSYVGTSQEASATIEAMYDMIFIDADHSYAGVKQDIALWESKLRPGGIWAFHDYGDQFAGVKQAVDERFGCCQSQEDVCVTLRVVRT